MEALSAPGGLSVEGQAFVLPLRGQDRRQNRQKAAEAPRVAAFLAWRLYYPWHL